MRETILILCCLSSRLSDVTQPAADGGENEIEDGRHDTDLPAVSLVSSCRHDDSELTVSHDQSTWPPTQPPLIELLTLSAANEGISQ